jgi:hypothetical protein
VSKIAIPGSVDLCRSHSNHWLFPPSSLVSSRVAQFLSRALPLSTIRGHVAGGLVMDHPHLRSLCYRFASQPILWSRLAGAFHARHRLFLPPRFLPRQIPCENQKPWALGRRRNSGSPCFSRCDMFFRVVEQPCIRKNFQRVDSGHHRRSTGLSSSLPFPQEHRCQLHSFHVCHRMGGLTDASTAACNLRSKDRRSELNDRSAARL